MQARLVKILAEIYLKTSDFADETLDTANTKSDNQTSKLFLIAIASHSSAMTSREAHEILSSTETRPYSNRHIFGSHGNTLEFL